ncbi:MAG: SIS domain-containing protein [Gemmataceae bacterium]|jgi:D-sedoheptulose 7-phosphate isomerase|nr:SIS domain-containing protein [Gemmataceae bacterium]
MLGVTLSARDYLARAATELARVDAKELEGVANAIEGAYRERRFVFVIGNGGSGANASHLCEDLGKCTLRREDFDNDAMPRLKILSLTDNTSYITAWANDEGYDRVFVEQLKNLASPGDVLIAISGSGNSPNILRAVEWANKHGLLTVGCTGYSGGKLRTLAKRGLHVPLDDMGMVESIHLTAFHWIIGTMHRRMNHRE